MGFIIESQGDSLIFNINGSRLLFHPTGKDIWVHATDGLLKIEKVGNFMFVNTSEAVLVAYPTATETWILSGGDPGPGPDPGTGDFSWPYKPDPGEWVTSEYGPRSGRFHEGIDMSGGPALYGEPIPAIGDATVQQSGLNGAFGYSVILDHGTLPDGFQYRSLYAHMPELAPRPSVGASVDKADIIGQVNNTGSSFGSHLHMEIHKTSPGAPMRWDTLNPSYTSPRTAINPRNFFTAFGDGTWIIS